MGRSRMTRQQGGATCLTGSPIAARRLRRGHGRKSKGGAGLPADAPAFPLFLRDQAACA